MGFQGSGLPNLATIQEEAASNLSAVGIVFNEATNGLNSVRLQIENAGPTNVVTVFGSVDGVNWKSVGTILGNKASIFNTQAYDRVKAEITTYGAAALDATWKFETYPSASGITGQDGNILHINPDGSINVNFASSAASVAAVLNVSIVSANTEYAFQLPAITKKFTLKSRIDSTLKLSFQVNGALTNYFTLYSGNIYNEEGMVLQAPLDIYVAASKPADTIEIIYWT